MHGVYNNENQLLDASSEQSKVYAITEQLVSVGNNTTKTENVKLDGSRRRTDKSTTGGDVGSA
ncbi:MAG: hypothetical protein II420_03625, partial [Oscillospiraceae bacterium]|nr:hypothetical protein [Oscillospiraceae bacterium]